MSKTYFITGTSSGFGRALAEVVLQKGDNAVLTARRTDALEEIASKYPNTALAIGLDVTDAAARKKAVESALNKFERIDVLANIAGRGSLGAVEEFTSAQFRDQMEVNFFGAAELTRDVLPIMRAQSSGHILNLTSIGGIMSIGGYGAYSASKFALEGWSEALRDEVKPLGIKVTLVEPGSFRTEFAGDTVMRAENKIDVYQPVVEPLNEYLYENDGKQPGDPIKAAQAMIKVVESSDPPLRLLLGEDALTMYAKKRDALEQEVETWREVSKNTAYEGVTIRTPGS